MIHIVVCTDPTSYNWRFVIDPLDRNLDVSVPNLSNADVEFALALAAQISAWKCRRAGLTKHMQNQTGLVDICPGDPDQHLNEVAYYLEHLCRYLLINWEDVKCKLPSMKSK